MIWLTLLLSVLLTWQDNSDDEDGFIVERALDCTQWEIVGYTGVGINSFVDPASQYSACYRVAAFNEALGMSGYSNTAQVPPPPTCKPEAKC